MKMKIIVTFELLITAIAICACGGKNKDQDGNTFKTVIIGNQEWMAENLAVGSFRNGDPIPQAKNYEDWVSAKEQESPIWCYYDFDPKYYNEYGILYNWFAVNDIRGLAPEGWHVATNEDWDELIKYAVGPQNAATYLKSSEDGLWEVLNPNCQNILRFSAVPGGIITSNIEAHIEGALNIGRVGYWWSSDSKNEYLAYSYQMYSRDNYHTGNEVELNFNVKFSSMSVRIISDEKPEILNNIKGNNVFTKIMTYKGCECNDECASYFVDEQGNGYDFGNPSNDKIKFNCEMDWDGTKNDELIGEKFKITYKKYSENDLSILEIILVASKKP